MVVLVAASVFVAMAVIMIVAVAVIVAVALLVFPDSEDIVQIFNSVKQSMFSFVHIHSSC